MKKNKNVVSPLKPGEEGRERLSERNKQRKRKMLEKHLDRLRHGCYDVIER